RITAINRGPESAGLHLLPTLWFRNTWSWDPKAARPLLRKSGENTIDIEEPSLGTFRFTADGIPPLLFTENESNANALWGTDSGQPYVKDAFHRRVIHGQQDAVNPAE